MAMGFLGAYICADETLICPGGLERHQLVLQIVWKCMEYRIYLKGYRERVYCFLAICLVYVGSKVRPWSRRVCPASLPSGQYRP